MAEAIKIQKEAATHLFLIPSLPDKFRFNCHRDWGQIITGDTKGLNIMQANEMGMLRGTSLEIALCWTNPDRCLTMGTFYEDEPFTELWGFPVSGALRDEFPKNSSGLKHTLIHRQSKDRFAELVKDLTKNLFNSWIEEGMPGEFGEYEQTNMANILGQYIFKFEFQRASGANGDYFWIKSSYRKPENEFEEAALEAAQIVFANVSAGSNWCFDPMLDKMDSGRSSLIIEGLAAKAGLPAGIANEALPPTSNGKQRQLKSANAK